MFHSFMEHSLWKPILVTGLLSLLKSSINALRKRLPQQKTAPMTISSNQLQLLFDQQRASFSFATVACVAQRISQLRELAGSIRAHENALVVAVDADFGGRNTLETRSAEIAVTVGAINHTIAHLKKWAKPRRMANLGNNIPGKTYVRSEAKGVVGVISPWNYPVQLSLVPLVTALAAGNRVMLKPSEFTPATNQVLITILGEVFAQDQVAVVTGEADVGQAFSELPFDHLFYTGSTKVGRLVAMAAAKNLTPVTLELGGKSPCLMMPDADPSSHSELVAFGKLYNAGQTCVAPDYLLVPEGQGRVYGEALMTHARRFYADGPAPEVYTSIISDRHHQRLTEMVLEAKNAGAEILTAKVNGAERPRHFPPTVVLSPPLQGALMAEEIFGPVLPIIEYKSVDQAVEFITQREHPLALYAFGKDASKAEAILQRTTSGGAVINGSILHVAVEHLPFGGVGQSGYGAYHGEQGFREFSHQRSVLVLPQWSFLRKILTPPYGKALKFITRKTINKKT